MPILCHKLIVIPPIPLSQTDCHMSSYYGLILKIHQLSHPLISASDWPYKIFSASSGLLNVRALLGVSRWDSRYCWSIHLYFSCVKDVCSSVRVLGRGDLDPVSFLFWNLFLCVSVMFCSKIVRVFKIKVAEMSFLKIGTLYYVVKCFFQYIVLYCKAFSFQQI